MKSDLEQVWKGLSSPIRRRILDLLREGPRTTGELAEAFPDLTRFAVMQHLGVLEEAGLLLPRREGRRRLNYLNAAPIRMLYERWVSTHAGFAAETSALLKQYAERQEEERQAMEMRADRVVKIETEIRVAAPPEKVFAALTEDLDAWWPHRFRPNGKMVMECKLGGRWYEDWGDGQGAQHAIIVWWEPPFKYAATGPGAMTRQFMSNDVATVVADGDGSIYRKSLTLWGDVPDELERGFREGARAALEKHLREYCENGARYVPAD
jgi:DNA-binding transcriptional ArsR family regulator